MNRKLNKFFKKYLLPSVIASGVCCLAAIIAGAAGGPEWLGSCFYILSALIAGAPILFKAIQSASMRVIGIELLVSIAVIGAMLIGEFNEAGIVTFLFQLGNLLELKTLTKTRNTIKALAAAAPKTAILYNNGAEEETDVDFVEEGDILALRTGRMVAVDGVITKGEGYFMEASVTGEAKPVHKVTGDTVYSGTIVDSGDALMRATCCGEDSTYSRIIALVEEAQDAKSPIDRFIDRFAKWYTPFVIALAVAVYLVRLIFLGQNDIDTAITILVLACPGALVIGVPVAGVAGIGNAAARHILLKGGDAIDRCAKVNAFVFDKTGTLTKGSMSVVEYRYLGSDQRSDEAAIVSLESKSDHPLAKAIRDFHGGNGTNAMAPEATVNTLKGLGLAGEINGVSYLAGSSRLLREKQVDLSAEDEELINQAEESGSSVVLVSRGRRLIMIYRIDDTPRDDAGKLIAALKQRRGSRVIMMTGDNQAGGEAMAKRLGITEYYCDLLPRDKLTLVKELKGKYNVCFVGDGINDSPALTLADTGVAVGSAAEAAVETADIVILRSDMMDVYRALKICEKTVRISYENIIIAVGTVALLLVGLFAGFIHMSSGMFVHEASILAVILNAMRLTINKGEKS